LALCLIWAAGCGGSGSSSESTAAAKQAQPAAERDPGPELTVPGGPPPKKLVVKDLKVGHGPAARRGDEVAVNYIGRLWTGESYSNSWRYGKAPWFTLGTHELIVGFDRGIRGMKPGGRRELLVPRRLDTFPGGPLTAGASPLVFLAYMVKVRPHR